MKMTDENALAGRMIDVDHALETVSKYCGVTSAMTRYIAEDFAARLAADQQKGGGEVAPYLYEVKWPDGVTTHPRSLVALEGRLSQATVTALYTAPQPSIPAPAQQDGKASGGEVDDEGPGTAWERWQKIPPQKGEPIREFDSFRAGYYAALAHPPHAGDEK